VYKLTLKDTENGPRCPTQAHNQHRYATLLKPPAGAVISTATSPCYMKLQYVTYKITRNTAFPRIGLQ